MTTQRADVLFALPSAEDWDEIIDSCAREVRSVGRRTRGLELFSRQLAHSLEELIGLHGFVSIDYAQSLLGRATVLFGTVEQLERRTMPAPAAVPAPLPSLTRVTLPAPARSAPPAAHNDDGPDLEIEVTTEDLDFGFDMEDEVTSPATPIAFANRKSGVMQVRPRSNGLRLKAS